MTEISMGRRILMALPTSIGLMVVFWIIGTFAVNLLPTVMFPPHFAEAIGALGFILGIAEQMVADFKAKLTNLKSEKTS